jgi:hypothetical protein
VDTFAVISYSDALQSPPQFAGSILAHGIIDNIVWSVPDPPLTSFRGDFTQRGFGTEFDAKSNWVYRLETTSDFIDWSLAEAKSAVTNGLMILGDTEIPSTRAFYRVIADRP